MPLKILIIGAGVCGPALALLLRRSNPDHKITVVERYPGLRPNGLQIDLRAQGIEVVRRLGLIDAIREKTVPEKGLALVDGEGKSRAVFGVNDSGKGQQSMTSEFEIMRKDLVEVLYQASLSEGKHAVDGQQGGEQGAEAAGGLRYEFNTSVTALSQDADGVDVIFSNGETGRYDLVVGADGQGSRTRRMLFGEEAGRDMFHPIGVFCAYFLVPRLPDENEIARFYHAREGRAILTRSGDLGAPTQAYFMCASHGDELRKSIVGKPVEAQKEAFARVFKNMGWQEERLIKGMFESTDFYAQEMGQVKCGSPYKGRIALLGDAGYCPSPASGLGTTLSLVGAYILAGELARHDNDVPAALNAYDISLRPYVDKAQKLLPGQPGLLMIKSGWGVSALHLIASILSKLKVDKIVNQIMPENKGGLKIPEYPELKLG
ncbi:FAD/NAD(P)-binding domain-containing protein [Xylariaceae sp. FL0662B]|nr:FAD/NAD(P)-binding domain-containing protein [Xylariaceae sp. FL0662B]